MNDGLAVNQIYGPGLGNESGIYRWPLAACSGKLVNGRFVSTSTKEALEILKEYKKQRPNVTEPFESARDGNEWTIVIILVVSTIFAILAVYFA